MVGNWRIGGLGLLLGFVLGGMGCATSTPVKEEPLPDDKQKELRETLTDPEAYWTHNMAGRSRAHGVKPRSDTYYNRSLKFKKDGTVKAVTPTADLSEGIDMEKAVEGKLNVEWKREWELEGRNIRIVNDEGEERYFRADSWSSDSLQLFDYEDSETWYYERREWGA